VWKEETLTRYFYQFDVDEILKIKLPSGIEEDFVAWHYEKTGCFSVRSAYRLSIELRDLDSTGSSTRPDGERPVWKKLWKLPIPQKVKVFAWKLAHNGLANEGNKKARKIAVLSSCKLCGGEETTHHVVIQCPHARNLRQAMRQRWRLPTEEKIMCAGSEWLLRLIDSSSTDDVGRVLLILWRAWFVCNELTHSTRRLSIVGSVNFLLDYWETLCNIRQGGVPDEKGKWLLFPDPTQSPALNRMTEAWTPPEEGWIKINVDGVFTLQGEASLGVVIRNALGVVLLSAWQAICNAASAEEVKLLACKEGLLRAAEFQKPAMLESDCLTAIKSLANQRGHRSAFVFLLKESIRASSSLPSIVFKHVKREKNCVAHELAQLARRLNHTVVWRNRVPACVEQLVARDCNPLIE
jgi:ribosomal protein L32